MILPIGTLALGLSKGEIYRHSRRDRQALWVLTVVLVALIVRDTSSLILRAHRWDVNLKSNICKVDIGGGALAGAELRYPPFQLGVSDVNSRQWISADYYVWLNAEIHNGSVICK